jgi:hypothetical protein
MGSDVDPLPSHIHFNSDGTVSCDNFGVDFGLYWVSQDDYYHDPSTPGGGGHTGLQPEP